MTAKSKAPGRGLRIVLGLSLALNLLFVGSLVGSALGAQDKWRGGGGPVGGKAMRGAESAIGIYGRALNKSERREVGRAIRAARAGQSDGRALRGQLRDLAAEALVVLRADTFDRDAFRDLLGQQQSMILSVTQSAQTTLVDYVGNMSDEARAAYADRLEAAMNRGPGRKVKAKP